MKVFFCRNCGFFQNWKEEEFITEKKERFFEGFSGKKIIFLTEKHIHHCHIPCPKCGRKGLFSGRGATISHEIIQRKMCFPVKEENTFFFLVKKSISRKDDIF